jgi:hypothetical protein
VTSNGREGVSTGGWLNDRSLALHAQAHGSIYSMRERKRERERERERECKRERIPQIERLSAWKQY